MYELQHMLAKTIIRISSPGPPSVSEESANAKRSRQKKSPRSLLPSSTTVNQCIYLRNVLRGTGVLVFGRCLELMGGCLWCPSVCQTLREWGNEGGWDTCLYPGCLFNTSRVMKDSWKHSRLFGFPLVVLRFTIWWRDFATVVCLCCHGSGWSWGEMGHRSVNISKDQDNLFC